MQKALTHSQRYNAFLFPTLLGRVVIENLSLVLVFVGEKSLHWPGMDPRGGGKSHVQAF